MIYNLPELGGLEKDLDVSIRAGITAEHVPTRSLRKFVRRMIVSGAPQTAIAELMGVSVNTLTKYYPAQLRASTVANQRVAMVLFRKALAGDITAAIFWLKARAGWRDRDATQLAVQVNANVASPEQLQNERDITAKIEQLRPVARKLLAGPETEQ